MFSIYIILAYVRIVVNLIPYTRRVFVQLYFQFFWLLFADVVDNNSK